MQELIAQRVYQIAAGYEDCNYCYMPLHIYEGLSGKLITTILKPGRRSKQAETGNLLIKIIKYLRQRWTKTTIIVHGDSHFTSGDLMDWCHDKEKVNFITGLAGNAKLKGKAQVTIKSAEREFGQYGKPVKRYHVCFYIPWLIFLKFEFMNY